MASMDLVPAIWTVVALVFILCSGIGLRLAGVFRREEINPLNRFVFMVGIPCLAFKAMATNSLSTLNWRFVLSFGAIRAVACVATAFFTIVSRGSVGDFACHYLASTWMDAVTLGMPVITALFGPNIGLLFPVLAAMSSFVFELPIILISFEVHRARSAAIRQQEPQVRLLGEVEPEVPEDRRWWGKWLKVVAGVAGHVLRMPPLIGIIIGMIVGTAGLKKLPFVLDTFCSSLGACVTPLATFNVGLFISVESFKRSWKSSLVYVAIKLLILPIVAIGIMLATRTASPFAEIAVIIASLPLAFPAFTIAKQFSIGEDVMSSCISVGCVLMLPVIVGWIFFLQSVKIFPSPLLSSSSSSP